ncbi:hypothetical protein RclHR1_07780001 [Rhizophagus clarus]|uniref:Uncharacterized protein n=1 Tax=Rhizophagus clarus TaxID=94130 RepID=A0A2Z6S4R6_9GLOM|nr:hypothetical protein RclHR1_07780001 [Rhizophagus clarus]GET02693.1 hypothetical protein RCL_jg11662.t1 [Rhizophagus clarus]
MNANTFLINISKSLQILEKQSNLLSITADKNELKLKEFHKSITNLATLIQQQNNSINQQFELIKENIDQLKSNQNNIYNKIDKLLSNLVNSNGFLVKSHKRKFKFVNDLLRESSESEARNESI